METGGDDEAVDDDDETWRAPSEAHPTGTVLTWRDSPLDPKLRSGVVVRHTG
jgi:hypothetical protein